MIPYVAPELLNFTHSSRFSKKSDIYSLGVLLWELSSGYPPFDDYSDNEFFRPVLIHKIIKGGREVRISDTPPDYYELYIACWNGNPEKRPIIEDVYDKLNSMLLKSNEDTKGNFYLIVIFRFIKFLLIITFKISNSFNKKFDCSNF